MWLLRWSGKEVWGCMNWKDSSKVWVPQMCSILSKCTSSHPTTDNKLMWQKGQSDYHVDEPIFYHLFIKCGKPLHM